MAVPVPSSVAVPRVAAPLLNVTEPAGAPDPAAPATTAVKITLPLDTTVIGEAVSEVDVEIRFTVIGTAADFDAEKSGSPI